MTPDTRTQLRAICAVCFHQQAVSTGLVGRLAQHGYRRPQGWYQNVNTCPGAGRPHFGTEAGRDVTANHADRVRAHATFLRASALEVASGEAPPRDRKGKAIEHPLPWQRTQAAAALHADAAHADAYALELDAKVAAWTPAAPVEVAVEVKGGPLVHFRRANFGKHCASSYMGAQKGYATVERENVTCPKCLALLARADAKRATVAQAEAR